MPPSSEEEEEEEMDGETSEEDVEGEHSTPASTARGKPAIHRSSVSLIDLVCSGPVTGIRFDSAPRCLIRF